MLLAAHLTELLVLASRGQATATEQLFSTVYPDLKRIAARLFRSERVHHSLQPTALVNEAYLRLCRSRPVEWRDRAHFFAVMSTQIRRILIDYGRAARTTKRGGEVAKAPLDEAQGIGQAAPNEVHLALDEALAALQIENARAARVVELKYFGGFTDAEIAELLNTSLPTVTRDWRYARAWLRQRLGPRTVLKEKVDGAERFILRPVSP